jgi:serine/threonine protein kinase
MACPLDDSLSALISGELAEPEADAVRTHLDSCESCRTTVAALALGHPRSSEDPSDPVQRPRSPGPTPGSRIDRYVIERLIGAGAMGVVYAAKDAALDRVIALKLLHGDHQLSGTLDPSGGDVGNEARTLARLDDPNVVKVWDVGVWEGRMFIAMELVQGQTLRAWMQKPQPYREVLSRLLGAGAGLAAAHDKGIIHRDFKPDNVLIAASGRALVTDFGLATESNRESTKIAGTPAYMARPR